MLKISHFTFLFFLISFGQSVAQDRLASEKVITISNDIRYFTVDDLLNIYTVNAKNEVIKYDIESNELFRYSNNELGELTSIDVSNPLNILLFFPEFQTAIALDRTMSQTGIFDFFNSDILDVSALCLSTDNKIWIYDSSNYKLKLIDGTSTTIEESDDLSYYIDSPTNVKQMLTQGNLIYLNMPETGIIVFDSFGLFDKVLPYKNVLSIQLLNEELLFQVEDNLFALNLETLQKRQLKTPVKLSVNHRIQVKNNYFFVLEKNKSLEIFKMK